MSDRPIPRIQRLFILNLRKFRNARNLPQKELADILSISIVYLNRIENGRAYPSADLTEAICLALKVLPHEMFL